MGRIPETNSPELEAELEHLRRTAQNQSEFILALISHSRRLRDALQETVVHALSPTPYGSTQALENALVALDQPQPQNPAG